VQEPVGDAADKRAADRPAVGGADDDRLDLLLLGEVVDHRRGRAAAEGAGLYLEAAEPPPRLFEQRPRPLGLLLPEDLVGDRQRPVEEHRDDEDTRPRRFTQDPGQLQRVAPALAAVVTDQKSHRSRI